MGAKTRELHVENQAKRIRFLLEQITAKVPHDEIILNWMEFVKANPFP